jgi:hypothetical protein
MGHDSRARRTSVSIWLALNLRNTEARKTFRVPERSAAAKLRGLAGDATAKPASREDDVSAPVRREVVLEQRPAA